VTNSENKLSQSYAPLNQTTNRLAMQYKQQLAKAIQDRDVARARVILSVLAVLNPTEYIEYLIKRKRKIEK
jgi:hypothetical protein